MRNNALRKRKIYLTVEKSRFFGKMKSKEIKHGKQENTNSIVGKTCRISVQKERRDSGMKIKEKTEQLKLWIKTHKKKIAACLAVILLAVGVLGISLAGMQQENEKAVAEKEIDQKKEVVGKKIAKAEIPKKEEKKNVSEKKDSSAKTEEEKTAEQKTEDATAETKQPVQQTASPETPAGNSGNTGGSNNAPVGNSGNGNSQPVHTHNYSTPVYTQQWVVDQPAWTETVSEPMYEMVERAMCNTCGMDITENAVNHLKELKHDGYHSEWIQKQTGTNTHTIPHPEQGHYESVVSGYQCSCGAVQ